MIGSRTQAELKRSWKSFRLAAILVALPLSRSYQVRQHVTHDVSSDFTKIAHRTAFDQMKRSLGRIKFAGPLIPHFGTLLSMPRDRESNRMFRFRNWTQELNVLRGMKERVVYTQAIDLSLRDACFYTDTSNSASVYKERATNRGP